MYELHEIDGLEFAATLRNLNSLVPEWPPLGDVHLVDGHWWIAFHGGEVVAFSGLVPFTPFPRVGYMKRCLVLPDHYGHGIQYRMMMARTLKAKALGYTTLVSECAAGNCYSALNFRHAGFTQVDPEQKWAAPNDLYWVKAL